VKTAKPTTFASRLTTLREAAGLTIPDLATAADLPRQTVHMLERGERQPQLDTVLRLCKALNCSLAEFDNVANA
jgi:transcriptional regulator with XRE-family HTH domain